jgi:hypothetical protein
MIYPQVPVQSPADLAPQPLADDTLFPGLCGLEAVSAAFVVPAETQPEVPLLR